MDTVGYWGRRAVSVGPEDRVSDAQLDGEVHGGQGLREADQHLLVRVQEERLPVVRSSGSWARFFHVWAAYRAAASQPPILLPSQPPSLIRTHERTRPPSHQLPH